MVGEFGVTAAVMRQVGIRLAGLLRFARPHGVGVDRVPFYDGAGPPIGRHAAHDKDVVVDRSAVGRQQADRHHRIGDDVHGGVESLAFGVGNLVLVGGWLEDRLQIDRHRMIAAGDHVFLVQVGGGKDVKQRQPRAGAPEKKRKAPFIRACRVIDEFAPAIAVPRNRANGFQRDRWVGAVQSLDQTVPGDVEPQILRLVDDAARRRRSERYEPTCRRCADRRGPVRSRRRGCRRQRAANRGGSPADPRQDG